MKRSSIHAYILALSVALSPTGLQAQTSAEMSSLRSAYDSLLRSESQGWLMYTYQAGSVGLPQIIAASGGTVVSRAAYQYTSGETDIVYTTIDGNRRTCLAYASESEACSLTGKVSTLNGSGLSAADAFVGGLIIAAIVGGLAGSGSSNSSSGDDVYARRGSTSTGSANSRPDNSVGCAWGDRDYGTCH